MIAKFDALGESILDARIGLHGVISHGPYFPLTSLLAVCSIACSIVPIFRGLSQLTAACNRQVTCAALTQVYVARRIFPKIQGYPGCREGENSCITHCMAA